MYASAEALALEHKKSIDSVNIYANNLIERFGNRLLGDTVARVGRDLNRKLSVNDRMMGAISLCAKHGIDAFNIKLGVASAMLFGEDYNKERCCGLI